MKRSTMLWMGLMALMAFPMQARAACEESYYISIRNIEVTGINADDFVVVASAASTTGLAANATAGYVSTAGGIGYVTSAKIRKEIKLKDLQKTLNLIREASVGSGLQFFKTLNELNSEESLKDLDSAGLAQSIVEANSKNLFCTDGSPLSYSEAVAMIKLILQDKVRS